MNIQLTRYEKPLIKRVNLKSLSSYFTLIKTKGMKHISLLHNSNGTIDHQRFENFCQAIDEI